MRNKRVHGSASPKRTVAELKTLFQGNPGDLALSFPTSILTRWRVEPLRNKPWDRFKSSLVDYVMLRPSICATQSAQLERNLVPPVKVTLQLN